VHEPSSATIGQDPGSRPIVGTAIAAICGKVSTAVLVAWFAVGKDGWITPRDILFPIAAAIAAAGVIAAACQRWRGLAWSLLPFAGCVIAGAVFTVGAAVRAALRTDPPFGSDGPHSGWTAQRVGDADGDGTDDFSLVTAFEPDERAYGIVRLISGSDGSVIQRWSLHDVHGRISPAGDIDGDGCADVVFQDRGSHRGWTVVRSGRTGATLLNVEDEWGSEFSKAGDIDGDGAGDLLIADPLADGAGESRGEVRVVSGSTGRELRRHSGEKDGDGLGWDVCDLGDVDRDGVDDYAIASSSRRTDDASEADFARVHSGRSGRLAYEIRDPRFAGHMNYLSVEPAGDVDRDGVPDLYVGTTGSNEPVLLLVSGASGSIVRRRTDVVAEFGSAGDVNGDGCPDLWLSAHASRVEDGVDGRTLLSMPGSIRLSAAGDLDADGFADLLRVTNRYESFDAPPDVWESSWRQGLLEVVSGRDGLVLLRVDGDSIAGSQ